MIISYLELVDKYDNIETKDKNKSYLNVPTNTTWTAPCENVPSCISGQRRSRSACAFAQSDQDLHCMLIESLDTTEYMDGEKKAQMILCTCAG